MAHVTEPTTLTSSTPAYAADVMAIFAAFLAQINGNIDATNLANGAVTAAKLAAALSGVLISQDGTLRHLNFGSLAGPSGFLGGRQVTWQISHGLGVSPGWVHVSNTIVAAASTSSAHDEPVSQHVTSVDSVHINVESLLPPGITASVGPSTTFWAAVG